MIDHSPEQVKQFRNYVKNKSLEYKKEEIEGRKIEYYVVPQTINKDLPYFVARSSNDQTKTYVIAVADSVPEELRKYFVLEEYIEFIEKGIETQDRVIEAEQEVVKSVPDTLRNQYLRMRIELFEKELELDTKQPEKYALGESGREEFQKNLAFLKSELNTNTN